MLVCKLVAFGLHHATMLFAMRQAVRQAVGASGHIQTIEFTSATNYVKDLEVTTNNVEDLEATNSEQHQAGVTIQKQISEDILNNDIANLTIVHSGDSGASGMMQSCDACPEGLVIDETCTECVEGRKTCKCGEQKKTPLTYYITHSTNRADCSGGSVRCKNGAASPPGPVCTSRRESSSLGYGMSLKSSGSCSYQDIKPAYGHSTIDCYCIKERDQCEMPCQSAPAKPEPAPSPAPSVTVVPPKSTMQSCSSCPGGLIIHDTCTQCAEGRKTCKCGEQKKTPLTYYITHSMNRADCSGGSVRCKNGAASPPGPVCTSRRESSSLGYGMSLKSSGSCSYQDIKPAYGHSTIDCYCIKERDQCEMAC